MILVGDGVSGIVEKRRQLQEQDLLFRNPFGPADKLHLGGYIDGVLNVVIIQMRGQLLLQVIEHFLLDIHKDRKSTRLNSSHVRISYAVFCLKKKMLILIAA